MSVKIRKHSSDDEMLEVFTTRDGKFILLGVLHADALADLGSRDLVLDEGQEIEIEVVGEQ